MSEADTPNNPPLSESMEPIEPIAVDSAEAIVAAQLQIANPAPPLESENVTQPTDTEAALEEGSSPASPRPASEEGDASRPTETAPPRQAAETDWIALTKKLRQRNRSLFNQVNELEQALKDCQHTLQSQQGRLQVQDTLLIQQSEEINTAQEQLTRLFRELESSHQVAQRQQILIETLSEQLENSQERIAQLERECAMTQQRYTEQSHQLLQTESTCQELHARLQRQQRQTLQFKSALEKCLEVPAPTYETNAEPKNFGGSQRQVKNIIAAQSLLPKAQPIQPWSSQADLLEEDDNLDPVWDNPTPPQLRLVTSEEVPTPEPLKVETALPEEMDDFEESVAESEDFEQGLEGDQWDEQSDLGWVYQLLDEPEADFLVEVTTSSTKELNLDLSRNQNSEEELSLEAREMLEELGEVSWEDEVSPMNSLAEVLTPEPVKHQQLPLSQPNWPSPVVYPLRPAKKLNSYAAIDLPSFPRYRSS